MTSKILCTLLLICNGCIYYIKPPVWDVQIAKSNGITKFESYTTPQVVTNTNIMIYTDENDIKWMFILQPNDRIIIKQKIEK